MLSIVTGILESSMIKVSKTVRDGSVRVTFALPASEPAGSVSVVGNFNNWDPFAHPLRKRSNGTRSTVVTTAPGSTLYFRYLGEGGHWFDDEAVHAVDDQGAAISV
jgi:1,4-alpha-glucan branching enzyme